MIAIARAATLLSAIAMALITSSGPSADATPTLPTERLTIDDLTYRGAFRLSSATFGDSNTNYAAGPLAYNASNHSLFVAGHAHHDAVAEFAIPATLGTGNVVADLPTVESPIQDFVSLLDRPPTGNGDGLDQIDGMFVHDGRLIVNAEEWYDADGSAIDTTLVVDDADDLSGAVDGFFRLDGGVRAGGYMSAVPPEWRTALGGPTITGWASNSSIISRHSIGPTMFTFDPDDVSNGDARTRPAVETVPHMDFPYADAPGGVNRWLTPDALDTGPIGASPLWNHLSNATFAFIAPGTATFVVVGSTGGIESGIGYKITQDNGNLCGGYCPYRHDDVTNAYWLFDVNEVLAADDVHLPRPYASGSWSVPFDGGGAHDIIGGTFDPATSTLYLSLRAAGQIGTYDRPPLIVVFGVPEVTDRGINRGGQALMPAERLDR